MMLGAEVFWKMNSQKKNKVILTSETLALKRFLSVSLFYSNPTLMT
jgi:hypothetical protein